MTAHVRRRGDRAELSCEPDLELLYEQYQPFVRAALRRHYVDPNDLEDMTQEVFLVLLRRVDETSRTRSLGAWLYAIARRVAANHHRGDRRRTRKYDELRATDEVVARGAIDPNEACARAEAWAFIRKFLESLDAEACAVFVMSEIEGLRGAEIAARLRISLPMTYARIRTVRERFARRVARERRGLLAGLGWISVRPLLAVIAVAMTASRRLKIAAAVILLALLGLFTLRGGGRNDTPETGTSASTGDRSRETERRAADDTDESLAASRLASRPTGTFAGIVIDPEGAPIARAIVCGDRTSAPDHPLTSAPSCTKSDRGGRFRIDGVLRHAHTLEAMARGFVPGRFHGRPQNDVRIVLHPGGVELSGVVSDVHGGPIEDAWVAVENRSEATLGATVTTDEAGAFSLWVGEGPVSLAAGASGYATSFHLALAPAQGVPIELGAESVIAGIVVDETGEPVADVRVSALLQEGSERYANRGGVAFSDESGRWEIRGLPPDQYVIDAAGDRGWGRADESIDLGIGDVSHGIRIELLAGVAIVGRIVDADTGLGCSDGFAITHDQPQSIFREGSVDAEGWSTVAPLSGGAVYLVEAVCRGYEVGQFEVDLRDGPAPSQTWPLTRGRELVVRVVDGTGAALPNWIVQLAAPFERDPSRAYDQPGDGTTDADGRVVFSGVPAGDCRVVAHGPGHPPIEETHVVAAATRTTIELRASDGVAITGTIVDARGEPVSGALVALQRPAEGRTFPHAYWDQHIEVDLAADRGPHHAVTDAAGRFRHTSVAPGDYGVWVLPEAAAVAFQRPRELPPGVAARVPGAPHRTITVADRPLTLALRVGASSSISGTVTAEDGDVVMDARVFAVREHEGGAVDPRGRPRLTDREGRYTLEDLADGTYTMIAYRPGGGIARRTRVAAGSRGVDLEIPRLGRISGTVLTAEGAAVRGFELYLHGGADDHAPFHGGSKDGRFAVGGLEAGRYVLRVHAPAGEGRTEVELGAGEERTGVVLTLARGANVKGRLVDENGAPATGWLAWLRTPGDGDDREVRLDWGAEIDDDGAFLIRGVFPQPLAIVAVRDVPEVFDPMQGGKMVHDATELRIVTLEDGETIDVGDLTLADGL
jgi:RNA polymerase sigma factor (sigma-70 family)